MAFALVWILPMKKLDSVLVPIIETLKKRQETLATAESCTGGMIAEWITRIPGVSQVYRGGVIAYANSVKIHALQVPKSVLEKHGAVSEAVAFYMAKGAQKNFAATWSISITGIAGPDGGSLNKPVGTFFLGIAGPAGIITKEIRLKDLGRQKNREAAAMAALLWLHKSLFGP